jgi:glycosyltransferase involved in cell wall biosynthesis
MNESEIEVSIVIPCLNEVRTVAGCVAKAKTALDAAQLSGEVVVADNGSTDGSQGSAAAAGARIVPVNARGYGNALMAGIEAARGRFVIMGDADGSYDFGAAPRFVEKLREGYDLVQGCRLPSGGGTIATGAMPPLHRWLGNPALTFLARTMFRTPVHDVYCGLRGFTKDFYRRMSLRCTGMEFATEMVVKAALYKVRSAEIPITLHRDGRQGDASHLRTFRDGWRTLRLFLLFSPLWLFFLPAAAFLSIGTVLSSLAFESFTFRGVTLGAHSLLLGNLAVLIGLQLLYFGLFAKTFAVNEGLVPESKRLRTFYRLFNLERAITSGGVIMLLGLGLILVVFHRWHEHGYGNLNYAESMRWLVPGVTLLSIGVQAVFGAFVVSIVGLARKRIPISNVGQAT